MVRGSSPLGCTIFPLIKIDHLADYLLMKIIMSIIVIYSSFLFGRGPAVEPTIGISIEEQAVIRPSKAKGYDFSAKDYGTLEKSKLDELIVLLILLVSLPLFFFIFLNLNKKTETIETLENFPERTKEDTKKAG